MSEKCRSFRNHSFEKMRFDLDAYLSKPYYYFACTCITLHLWCLFWSIHWIDRIILCFLCHILSSWLECTFHPNLSPLVSPWRTLANWISRQEQSIWKSHAHRPCSAFLNQIRLSVVACPHLFGLFSNHHLYWGQLYSHSLLDDVEQSDFALTNFDGMT